VTTRARSDRAELLRKALAAQIADWCVPLRWLRAVHNTGRAAHTRRATGVLVHVCAHTRMGIDTSAEPVAGRGQLQGGGRSQPSALYQGAASRHRRATGGAGREYWLYGCGGEITGSIITRTD
jgi:hypothetical protein